MKRLHLRRVQLGPRAAGAVDVHDGAALVELGACSRRTLGACGRRLLWRLGQPRVPEQRPRGAPSACSNEERNSRFVASPRSLLSFSLNRSCTRRIEPTFLTSPLSAPQCGHSRVFLHLKMEPMGSQWAELGQAVTLLQPASVIAPIEGDSHTVYANISRHARQDQTSLGAAALSVPTALAALQGEDEAGRSIRASMAEQLSQQRVCQLPEASAGVCFNLV